MKLAYHIGRHSLFFRKVYWRVTGGSWWWGVEQYVIDRAMMKSTDTKRRNLW